MKKTLCIAPFTKDSYFLYENLREEYAITAFLSPKGIGFQGDDIGVLRNYPSTGYFFTNSIEESCHSAETFIICDISTDDEALYSYALNVLRSVSQLGKEIYCFLNLKDYPKIEQEVVANCRISGGKCIFPLPQRVVPDEFHNNSQLYDFDVPIFIVSEVMENCDGYDFFIQFVKGFQAREKSVLAVSDDIYNSLWGFEFFDFNSVSRLSNAVLDINRAIYALCQYHRPEVIVIRHSQPIMKYDQKNVFDGGLTAFATAMALPISGCVMCSLCDVGGSDLWKTLNSGVLSRYGYPIIAVHVSNQILDSSSNEQKCLVRIPINCIPEGLFGHSEPDIAHFVTPLNQSKLVEFIDFLITENLDLEYGVI